MTPRGITYVIAMTLGFSSSLSDGQETDCQVESQCFQDAPSAECQTNCTSPTMAAIIENADNVIPEGPHPNSEPGSPKDRPNKAPQGAPWSNCPVYKMPYSKCFDCDDFTQCFDYYCEKKLGINCFQIGFSGSKPGTGHAFNVVEKGPRTSSYLLWSYTTYCAVEPQTNAEITCWTAQVGQWQPNEFEKDEIVRYFNENWNKTFYAKSWQYWDNCHDPKAGEEYFDRCVPTCNQWEHYIGDCPVPPEKW